MSQLIPSSPPLVFGGMFSGFIAAGAADPLAGLLLLRLEGDQIKGLSNNAPAPSWPDIGNGNTPMTQAASSQQGLWQASDAAFNGKPSVLFDAVDDGMLCACSLAIPYTLIFVGKPTGTSSKRFLQSGTQNRIMSLYRANDAVYLGSDVVISVTQSGAHILSLEVGAQSRCYLDGVDITGSTSVLADWGTVAIGAAGTSNDFCDGRIAAIGAFASVNTTTRQLIESTWKAKYGTP